VYLAYQVFIFCHLKAIVFIHFLLTHNRLMSRLSSVVNLVVVTAFLLRPFYIAANKECLRKNKLLLLRNGLFGIE